MKHMMLLLLVHCSLLTTSGSALAVNKCEVDGKIIYSDTPCTQGKASILKVLPGPDQATIEDAQRKAAAEKGQLAKLEADQAKQAAQEARAQAKLARLEKRKQQQAKRCEQLALYKGWAEQDAAQAGPKSEQKARTRARRLQEQHKLECADNTQFNLL